MVSDTQKRSMLTILLAACETTLDAFQAADNQLDRELVADLERVIERTRGELEAFPKKPRHSS
jgi:hypothetical protein